MRSFAVTVPRLELWFANQDGLVDLLGVSSELQSRYLTEASDSDRDIANKQHDLAVLLERRLASDPPPELQRVLLAEPPSIGALVSVEQAFYFKKQRSPQRVLMHGKLNTDSGWTIRGLLDPARFPFASTHDYLAGQRNVFVVGTVVEVIDQSIAVRPLFVGHRTWDNERGETFDTREIHAMDVDQFSKVDWATGLSRPEMRIMNQMRESDVKDHLAEILGIPFVPKDWGGERSDMSTNNLLVRGQQVSAAWLLKGRSVQGPMKLKDLGKNGDQIERLATEPVDVLIVQHNNSITAPVVNLAKAFAYDMRNPRRFIIMDGNTTGMVLRDYGFLK